MIFHNKRPMISHCINAVVNYTKSLIVNMKSSPDFMSGFETGVQKMNGYVSSRLTIVNKFVGRATRSLVLIMMIAIASIMTIPNVAALELGLTPSNVFSIWTNINNTLITISRVVSDDPVWQKEILSMNVRQFKGKHPVDVLEQVKKFDGKLFIILPDESPRPEWKAYGKSDGADVTPTIVFQESGHVLGDVVIWLTDISDRNQLVSQFFTSLKFTEKTPSDVFGLVDLAQRRLDRILAKKDE